MLLSHGINTVGYTLPCCCRIDLCAAAGRVTYISSHSRSTNEKIRWSVSFFPPTLIHFLNSAEPGHERHYENPKQWFLGHIAIWSNLCKNNKIMTVILINYKVQLCCGWLVCLIIINVIRSATQSASIVEWASTANNKESHFSYSDDNCRKQQLLKPMLIMWVRELVFMFAWK